jgi:ABC-type bacteriocin/lantibiotic exporter with double-glycine peptidase domain
LVVAGAAVIGTATIVGGVAIGGVIQEAPGSGLLVVFNTIFQNFQAHVSSLKENQYVLEQFQKRGPRIQHMVRPLNI